MPSLLSVKQAKLHSGTWGLKATKERHDNNNWKQKNKFPLRVEAAQWKGQDSNLTFMSEVLLSNGYHPSILAQ